MSTEAPIIISATLFTEEWQSQTPRRLVYRGELIALNSEEYQNLLSEIPEFWHTENDKLITFRYYKDDTIFCERLKKVYDYSTREWIEKYYVFNPEIPEEVKNLVNIFSEFYQNYKVKQIQNINDSILKSVKDYSYVKNVILNSRERILKQTDYMFVNDYKHSDERIKQEWIDFRQSLRDITQQPAWVNEDYANIQFPISPDPKKQFDQVIDEVERFFPNIFQDFDVNAESTESIEELMKTISQYVVKTQIISGIANLKLPLFDLSVGTFDFNYVDDSDTKSFSLFKSEFEEFKNKVDEQFKTLGSSLTIDVIMEQMKQSLLVSNVDEEVYDIIDELNQSIEE
jgi:hypothetical protein